MLTSTCVKLLHTNTLPGALSQRAMGTPVRGKNCRHMQCFDLQSFLHSNKHVSGGRWRCAVCEDFLSVHDLVRCGLFEAMLDEHREEVSGARDKVSFQSDGTFYLKEPNKLRYAGKSSGQQAIKDDSANQKQPEVMDLLSDSDDE